MSHKDLGELVKKITIVRRDTHKEDVYETSQKKEIYFKVVEEGGSEVLIVNIQQKHHEYPNFSSRYPLETYRYEVEK